MKLLVYSLFLILFVITLSLWVAPTKVAISAVQQDVFGAKVQDKVNTWRKENGKQTYQTSPKLCEIATERVGDIQQDWSHNGFTGRIKDTNYLLLGENLAKNFDDPELMLKAWLDSEGHRKNLTEDFTDTCVVCKFNEKGSSYCVQLFAK